MFCNQGFCHPDGSRLTVLFPDGRNSSQSWDRSLSQRPWKTEATSLDSGETGGGWSEPQCPSPPGSEAARESRWDAGAQSQRRCLCLHAAPPTTAQGCDLGRKTCSGSIWDMLGIGKISREEHTKGGLQRTVLSRLLTWPIGGYSICGKRCSHWHKGKILSAFNSTLCNNTIAFIKNLAIIFDIKNKKKNLIRCLSYHCWKQINCFIWHYKIK